MKHSYAVLIGVYARHFHQFRKTFSQLSLQLSESLSSLLNGHHTTYMLFFSANFYQN